MNSEFSESSNTNMNANTSKRFFQAVFTRCNERRLKYCVLDAPPNALRGIDGDVDIWVRPDQNRAFYDIIKKVAREHGLALLKPNVSPRLSSEYEGKYYLVKEGDPSTILHLDVWSYLYWRGVPFIDIVELEKAAIRGDNGIMTLDVEVTEGLNIVKDLLHRGVIKEKRKNALIRNDEIGWSRLAGVLDKPLGKNIVGVLVDFMRQRNWSELEMLSGRLRIVLIQRAVRLNPWRQVKYWLAYSSGALGLYLRKYGLFVVFIGPDGSGKTTMARGIMESAMAERLFAKRQYFHSRFPCLPAIRRIGFYLGLVNKNKLYPEKEPPRKTEPLPSWRSVIYPLYYGVGNLLAYPWIWLQKSRGGSLVVLDRYFYEYYIQSEFNRCPRGLLKFVERLIPSPDMIIDLHTDAETIFTRKQEISLEHIEQQLYSIERILKDRPNAIVVDTSGEVKQTIETVLKHCVGQMIKRYEQ